MGELALRVRSGALLPLELPAHLQLKPAGVLLVEQRGHVEHGEHLGVHVGGVGHRRVCGHQEAVSGSLDAKTKTPSQEPPSSSSSLTFLLLFHRLDEYRIVNFLTALPPFSKMLDFEISSGS